MPGWYDQAQQNIASGAGTAYTGAPSFGQTTSQQAVDLLQGGNNPFTQSQNALSTIASGAASPWIVDPTTGNVTPNTGTALGGLFQAQNQQLQQTIPNLMAEPTAGAIGSGQFGSLRGMTAQDKAIADAQAQLFTQQMQAALNNQQTGVQAGTGLGTVGGQNISNALTVGGAQQAAPFTNVANYGKVIGGLQAPTTTTNVTNLAPLQQIAALASGLGGTAAGLSALGSTSLGKTLGGGISGLINSIGSGIYNSTVPQIVTDPNTGVTTNYGTVNEQNAAQSGDMTSNIENAPGV